MCPSPAVSSSPSSSLQYREVAELLSIVNICSSMDMTNSPTPAANQAPPHALSTAITAACSCLLHVSILQPGSQHTSLAASCICTVLYTVLYCTAMCQYYSQAVSMFHKQHHAYLSLSLLLDPRTRDLVTVTCGWCGDTSFVLVISH